MDLKVSNYKGIYFSLLLLFLVCIGFMIAEIINHRFWLSDFEVYYKAANRILNGNNLYRYVEDNHYVFKYSPVSAIYFIPFTVIPFEIAKYIYWIILTLTIITGFYLSIKAIEPTLLLPNNKKKFNIYILVFIPILALHFLRELHLGQVNYLLLFIFILAINAYPTNKMMFGILIAISFFIKPFALIFIPYLILKKDFRSILIFQVTIICISLLPFLFYDSSFNAIKQYVMWFEELKIELSHKQGLLANANHTIFSVIARYTPIRFIIENSIIAKVFQLIILILIGLFIYYFIQLISNIKDSSTRNANTKIDLALLIAFIPLLAFTSENAFIYTQLVVFIVIINFKKLKMIEKIMAIIGCLFIGGNFGEVVGKELSQKIDDISLISIGAILLIYLVYSLRKKQALN